MTGEKIKLLIKNGDFSWDASNMSDKSLQKNITKMGPIITKGLIV
jgi:hypothetical protein